MVFYREGMEKYIIPPVCSVIALIDFHRIDIDGGAIGIIVVVMLVVIILYGLAEGLRKWFHFEP